MSEIIAVLVGAIAFWILAHIIAALLFIFQANKMQREDMKYMQGSVKDIISGILRNPPASSDFRVVRGVEWDPKELKYKPQSRLSIEAIKSVFFR